MISRQSGLAVHLCPVDFLSDPCSDGLYISVRMVEHRSGADGQAGGGARDPYLLMMGRCKVLRERPAIALEVNCPVAPSRESPRD
jgi:hypothetical protein